MQRTLLADDVRRSIILFRSRTRGGMSPFFQIRGEPELSDSSPDDPKPD